MRYSGSVSSIPYDDPAQSFYIMKMRLDGARNGELISVKGNVPILEMKPGVWFCFEAKETTHEKYGKQLDITSAPLLPIWTEEVTINFLSANGVSRGFLLRVRDAMGDGFIEALNANDEQPFLDEAFDHAAVKNLLDSWNTSRAFLQTLDFLIRLKVPKQAISQIWSALGDKSETTLSTNPWFLVKVDGITFEQADQIARGLRLDMSDPHRLQGAILSCLKGSRMSGDMFTKRNDLYGRVNELLDGASYTAADFKQALTELGLSKDLVLDGPQAVYEPWLYDAEVECAKLLKERMVEAAWDKDIAKDNFIQSLAMVDSSVDAVSKNGDDDATLQAAVQQAAKIAGVSLTADQSKGVYHALRHSVSIISGLPGTGKSTSVRTLVRVLQAARQNVLLVAPTGIAAKRLAHLTGHPAYTIHRAFGAKGSSDNNAVATYAGVVSNADVETGKDNSFWEYGLNNPHPARYVIVDESSMISADLLLRLLSCTGPECRLVFVGDPAQLPSVGPGNVLRDMMRSDVFPAVFLKDIFRQEEASAIVVASHQMFRGEVPEATQEGDFVFVQKYSDDAILATLQVAAKTAQAKGLDYQIISPRHGGKIGVTNLNAVLRELLNPQKTGLQEAKIGGHLVRERDKVMVIKNNYTHGIYNGDLGKIIRIDTKSREVEVEIGGLTHMRVLIAYKDVSSHLRLAYASTVHRVQGLEFDTIIMALSPTFGQQLQRNLLYTAVTRAKRKVMLIGNPDCLGTAIHNNKEIARNTKFAERLCEDPDAV